MSRMSCVSVFNFGFPPTEQARLLLHRDFLLWFLVYSVDLDPPPPKKP